jgi:uncharacterized protein (TIGR04255 family)
MKTHGIHFSRAPIIEAIINLEVALPESAHDPVRSWGRLVGAEYSEANDLIEMTGEVRPAQEPQGSFKSATIGVMYRSKAVPQLFQSRINGFSFHRLAPYESWEPFRGEAKRLWNLYRSATGVHPVRRYDVRYINRLDIPAGQQLSEFFNTYPEVAKGLPQMLNGYLMRLEIPLDDFPGGVLVLQEYLVPSDKQGMVGVMLDNGFRFPVKEGISDEELWSLIESVREIKNRTFLDCLTSRMQEAIL